MPHVQLDGEPFAGVIGPGPFGEILGVVEPTVATRSRVVTAVRINGVDEPAFREAAVSSRPVAVDDRVDMDTTSTRQLASDALDDAVRLSPALCDAAGATARQLRGPAPRQAAGDLAPLAEGLTLLVTLIQAAEAWADAARLPHDSWLGADVAAVGRGIDALEAAQRREAWDETAAVLDDALVPALEAWRARLAAAVAALPSVPEPDAASR